MIARPLARSPHAYTKHQLDAGARRFISEILEAGEYQNASEAIRDAVRLLQQRRREDALKLKVLRSQLKAGVEALKRGEFVEVDEVDLVH